MGDWNQEHDQCVHREAISWLKRQHRCTWHHVLFQRSNTQLAIELYQMNCSTRYNHVRKKIRNEWEKKMRLKRVQYIFIDSRWSQNFISYAPVILCTYYTLSIQYITVQYGMQWCIVPVNVTKSFEWKIMKLVKTIASK